MYHQTLYVCISLPILDDNTVRILNIGYHLLESKNKPIHPPPSLSLREQGGLEVEDFTAILLNMTL